MVGSLRGCCFRAAYGGLVTTLPAAVVVLRLDQLPAEIGRAEAAVATALEKEGEGPAHGAQGYRGRQRQGRPGVQVALQSPVGRIGIFRRNVGAVSHDGHEEQQPSG